MRASDGHFPVAAAFIDPKRCEFVGTDAIRTPEAILAAIETELARFKPDGMILSAEHFSSRLGAVEIVRLRELLRAHEVEIICYARRQDELALSSYATAIITGRRTPFSLDDVTEKNRYFNYCAMLDDWAAAFGKDAITLRSYERACASASVIDDFMSLLGITDLSDWQRVERLNERLSARQAHVLMHVNRVLPSWGETWEAGSPQDYSAIQRVRKCLLRFMQTHEPAGGEMPFGASLPSGMRHEILARFRSSNAAMRAKYLNNGDPQSYGDVPVPKAEPIQESAPVTETTLLAETIVGLVGEIAALEAEKKRLEADKKRLEAKAKTLQAKQASSTSHFLPRLRALRPFLRSPFPLARREPGATNRPPD